MKFINFLTKLKKKILLRIKPNSFVKVLDMDNNLPDDFIDQEFCLYFIGYRKDPDTNDTNPYFLLTTFEQEYDI